MIVEGVCLATGAVLTWYFAMPGKGEELRQRRLMHNQINEEQVEAHRTHNTYLSLLYSKINAAAHAHQTLSCEIGEAHRAVVGALENTAIDAANASARIQRAANSFQQVSFTAENETQSSARVLTQTMSQLTEQFNAARSSQAPNDSAVVIGLRRQVEALVVENKNLKSALEQLLNDYDAVLTESAQLRDSIARQTCRTTQNLQQSPASLTWFSRS